MRLSHNTAPQVSVLLAIPALIFSTTLSYGEEIEVGGSLEKSIDF